MLHIGVAKLLLIVVMAVTLNLVLATLSALLRLAWQ
jgi:hypothetical protein